MAAKISIPITISEVSESTVSLGEAFEEKNQTLNFFKRGGVNTKVNIFEIKFLTKVEYRIFKPGEQTECFDVKVSKI